MIIRVLNKFFMLLALLKLKGSKKFMYKKL